MSALMDLPDSVLEDIVLALEHLRDVSAMAQTCSRLRLLIYKPSDRHLWRELYLARYESPLPMAQLLNRTGTFEWQKTLQERRRVLSALARSRDLVDTVAPSPLVKEVQHLIDALHNDARPGPGQSDIVDMVRDVARAQPVLTFSGRPACYKSGTHESPPFDRTLCRLSTYFGADRPHFTERERGGARACVYQLSFWRDNGWSPFDADGSANWPRIEALALVACANAAEFGKATGDGRVIPCCLPMARPFTQPGWADDSTAGDWAGIQGVWRRCINFMDWHTLFAFQRSLARGAFRSPADFFLRIEQPEAVHVHSWRFHVTHTVDNPQQPRYPDIHWAAEMTDDAIYSLPPKLRGRVSMTPDGDVKWNSITTFEGVDAYCSTGIQVGGIRSGFGVVALWSGTAHEAGDPAGPS